LHEVRAVAAFAVVWHHIELFKHREGMASLFDTPLHGFIKTLGKNGVFLFFVLSGFLITYLLLAEAQKTGRIDTRAFYIRRVLRIWPLYYMILILGFIVMPLIVNSAIFEPTNYTALTQAISSDMPWNLVLYAFLLPHVALNLGFRVAAASQSWSIGLEEQFYIVWPWLFLLLRSGGRRLALGMTCLLAGGLLVTTETNQWVASVLSVFGVRYMSLMAVGCAGAYAFYYHRKPVQGLFGRRATLVLVSFLGVVFLLVGHRIPHTWRALVAGPVGLAAILVVLSHQIRRINALEALGGVSYGVYMLHPFVIFNVVGVLGLTELEKHGIVAYNFALYTVVVILTVVAAFISFWYVEAPFLRLKNRFSRV